MERDPSASLLLAKLLTGKALSWLVTRRACFTGATPFDQVSSQMTMRVCV